MKFTANVGRTSNWKWNSLDSEDDGDINHSIVVTNATRENNIDWNEKKRLSKINTDKRLQICVEIISRLPNIRRFYFCCNSFHHRSLATLSFLQYTIHSIPFSSVSTFFLHWYGFVWLSVRSHCILFSIHLNFEWYVKRQNLVHQ